MMQNLGFESTQDRRRGTALLICRNPGESDDFVQIPSQRERIRSFAASQNIKLQGEIICEIETDNDLELMARDIIERMKSKNEQNLIVANVDLLNASGLAAQLLTAPTTMPLRLITA